MEESHPGLSADHVQTLKSLQPVDDFPMYTMHYVGAYLEDQITQNQRIQPEIPRNFWACTLFAALAQDENMLYGRNFDWDYSPVLLLHTDPPGGYAAVSVVDLAYFDFSDKQLARLDELSLPDLSPLLEAPWWPFDGMNEHGLVIGMAAVPSGNMTPDPTKDTLDSLEVMRKVLDEARNVEEALKIFQNHNLDMERGPDLHYLIADRSGRAILIEFYRGEMIVIPNERPWHLATNFLCSSVSGDPGGRCWRYDAVFQQLSERAGALQVEDGLDLLERVSQLNTQWSVLYGISSGKIDIVVGKMYENVHSFDFELNLE
jgi:hypothetical protein